MNFAAGRSFVVLFVLVVSCRFNLDDSCFAQRHAESVTGDYLSTIAFIDVGSFYNRGFARCSFVPNYSFDDIDDGEFVKLRSNMSLSEFCQSKDFHQNHSSSEDVFGVLKTLRGKEPRTKMLRSSEEIAVARLCINGLCEIIASDFSEIFDGGIERQVEIAKTIRPKMEGIAKLQLLLFQESTSIESVIVGESELRRMGRAIELELVGELTQSERNKLEKLVTHLGPMWKSVFSRVIRDNIGGSALLKSALDPLQGVKALPAR